MKHFLALFFLFFCTFINIHPVFSATIKNEDVKSITLIIVESHNKHSIIVEPKQQMDICSKGCFLTLSNGDKYALLGNENISIMDNRLTLH